jgi:hypothetical protein
MYLYFEHYFWKYDTSVSVYYLLFHTGKTYLKYHRNNQYRHILKFHDWWIEKNKSYLYETKDNKQIPLPIDVLTVSYLLFHFHLIVWLYHICHSTYIWCVDYRICHSIWYSQHINWKWNDIYDAVNTSDESGMTDMIESTYQMEVEWHMIQSTYQMEVISVIQLLSDMLTVSYLSFHFHLICWVYYICHSTSIWYVDCIPWLINRKKSSLTCMKQKIINRNRGIIFSEIMFKV